MEYSGFPHSAKPLIKCFFLSTSQNYFIVVKFLLLLFSKYKI